MTNSIHDMGGMHGFGPVEPEPDEPVFHAAWEKRVLAMQRAMGATRLWTIDGGRASLESLPPLDYLVHVNLRNTRRLCGLCLNKSHPLPVLRLSMAETKSRCA